ncbi:MAG: carbohydrate ABC transporter permease [Candidatus Odinarchaeota archaeon]
MQVTKPNLKKLKKQFPNLEPSRIVLYVILIMIIIITLLPLWSAVMTAFKTKEQTQVTSPYDFPTNPTLEPLITTFGTMFQPLINSLVFTVIGTILSCLIGSITGYALSKFKFRGSEAMFLFIITGIFIPYQAVLIPLVITMVQLHLFDTVLALIITHTAYGIPICTLLFRSFYEEIPDSLIKAAIMDGAGTLRIYRRIILPLSPLAFVVATVFQFTNIWNDFLFGLVLSGTSAKPASVALANLKGSSVALWHYQMAGVLWYSIPSLIVYFLLGKYLIKGFMTGAIKG